MSEKVEGFFQVCERTGLTGDQGVILPRRNVRNLMLGRDVRETVEAGRFHVWAIRSVEEGWPILTGRPAGEADADGTFPEGSVYRAVSDRLATWGETWQRIGKRSSEES